MQKLILNLTLFRIVAAPIIFISIIFLDIYWFAFSLFNLAALTDYFDGKLARKYKLESRLGAILDPIGDKLLVVFTLVAVIILSQDSIIALMGVIILARELWVSALREYSSANHNSNATAVLFTAKAKTAFQFIALGMYLLGYASNIAMISFLANFVMLIAVFLAIKSAISYTLKTLSS